MSRSPEKKRVRSLAELGALREGVANQQQMMASSGDSVKLDSRGIESVAAAHREFSETNKKYGNPLEAATEIGKMLTEDERLVFMGDLTTAGLLEPVEGTAQALSQTPPPEYQRPDNLPDGWTETLIRNKVGKIFRLVTDGKMEARREATDDDRSRLAWTLSDIQSAEMVAPQSPSAPKEPLRHEGAGTEDDELAKRQAHISSESKKRKEEKKRAKTETRANAPKEAPDARIQRLAEEFNTFGEANGAEAADKYVEMRDALPENERGAFREAVIAYGWNINGDLHGTQEGADSDYIELLPLGTDITTLKEKLGPYEALLDGIPYWVLPDGHAAVMGRRGEHATRVGPGGVIRVKNRWYRFENRSFNPVSAEDSERLERMEQKRRAAEERPAPSKKPEKQAAGPGKAEGAREGTGTKQEEPKEDRPEKTRSFEEALRIFLKNYKKEKKNAGVVFRDAVRGISDKNRKRLIDFLVETTDIPRNILERIHKDTSDEHKKGAEQRIEDQVDALFAGRTQGTPQEAQRQAPKGKTDKEIEDEVEALFKNR